MAIKIWGISDNKLGHLSQIKSVLSLIPFEKKLFTLNNSMYGKLSYSFFPLGVTKNYISKFKEELKIGYPHIIIAIGRRNLSVSLYLKRIIKKQNKHVKLIFLMPPGTLYNRNIDYMFMHKYKLKQNYTYPSNIIAIDFPPAQINNNIEKNTMLDLPSVFKNNLNVNVEMKKPYIGVAIGGKAKGVKWNVKGADILCKSLIELNNINQGTLFVITSRRTGSKVSSFIKNKLPNNSFFWEYSNTNAYNPYLDILRISDAIVVTGESTSMMADSISLNSSAKVLVFDNNKLKSHRFKAFREFLYKNNYAVPLNEGKISIKQLDLQKKAQNSAYFIANFIINLVTKNNMI